MSRSILALLAIVALLQVDALSTVVSRRSFFASTATVAATSFVAPAFAAAEKPKKKRACQGTECSASYAQTWDGRAMTGNEQGTASGLLDKLGVPDIAPDKDEPKAKK